MQVYSLCLSPHVLLLIVLLCTYGAGEVPSPKTCVVALFSLFSSGNQYIRCMMYLGIDPGIRKLGYALIDHDCKVIDAGILLQDMKAPTRHDQFTRLYNIYSFFLDMFTKYDIKQVAIEKLFFTSRNQSNAEFVYGVRGALIALAYEYNVGVLEYAPVELKKAITGNGKASKTLVQSAIMKSLRLSHFPQYNDAADALGLAYIARRVSTISK